MGLEIIRPPARHVPPPMIGPPAQHSRAIPAKVRALAHRIGLAVDLPAAVHGRIEITERLVGRDRKSPRLTSSHSCPSRVPSPAGKRKTQAMTRLRNCKPPT